MKAIRGISGIAETGAAQAPAPGQRPTADRLAVEVRELGKDFRHNWTRRIKTAVHSVSFGVPQGSVFGLLGPNGAGKTTTLKMLLGLLPATRGEAWLLGRPAGLPSSRHRVGFLPENPYFYDHLTAEEFLIDSGALAGMGRASAKAQAKDLLVRVGLDGFSKSRMRKFSKGMLQRAGLAHALMGDPELLFLDEPMSGLDPIGRREVVDLLRELREEGRTIVFSSHILHDVETLCDRVVILRAGRVVAEGPLDRLLDGGHGDSAGEIVARVSGPLLLPTEFAGVAIEPLGSRVRIVVPDSTRMNALVAWLAGHGVEIVSLSRERRSLEDLFMAMFQDAHEVGGDLERSASDGEGGSAAASGGSARRLG